jgi:hypothetical protein
LERALIDIHRRTGALNVLTSLLFKIAAQSLVLVPDALLESWAELVPASLETLSGLERNKVYRMLNLLVSPSPEGYEVSGSFCIMEPCGSS